MPATALRPLKYRTKGQLLCDELRQLAHELGPSAKLPTVVELRASLAVSLTTLNTALGELEASGIIERKHGIGIFVSPHLGRKSIGLVCDPAFFGAGTSPFWPELIEGIRKRSSGTGDKFRFYLAIPSGSEDVPVHDDLLEDVRASRLHGVVFIGHNKPAIFWLKAQGVPTVAFAGWSEWSVRVDYDDLVRQAAAVLLQRGAREIGLIVPRGMVLGAPPLESQAALALRRFCQAEQLTFKPEWVWEGRGLDEGHEVQGYRAMRELFSGSAAHPHALIIVDDLATRGAMAAAEELGLTLGKDVQIASHSNRGSAVLAKESRILRVEIDPAEIVASIFGTLELLMLGRVPLSEVTWIKARPSTDEAVHRARKHKRK